MVKRTAHSTIPVLAILMVGLLSSGCFLIGLAQRREILERKHVSNFTPHNNRIYFGAGYSLYSLNPSSKTIDEVYRTDRLRVEQPIVDGTTIYFGGLSYTNELGVYGERQGFLAIDLESQKKIWKFELGVGGYGTFGTYPVIAGDNVLVCARQHLHSLDKKTGKENWKVNNWLGRDSDGITIPYVFTDSAYYKISEEYFTKNDSNDGQWAKIDLTTGARKEIFNVISDPGTYHDNSGDGVGLVSDGKIFGALRYNGTDWPSSFFGALDLSSGKVVWEVPVGAFRTKPAATSDTIFTFNKSSLLALDKNTGKTKWSEPVDKIAQGDIDRSKLRSEWDYEHHYSRRLATDGQTVIARGSRGIEARSSQTGRLIWRSDMVSKEGDSDPLIYANLVISSSVSDCSLVAFDLTTGKLEWKVNLPNCSYRVPFDD